MFMDYPWQVVKNWYEAASQNADALAQEQSAIDNYQLPLQPVKGGREYPLGASFGSEPDVSKFGPVIFKDDKSNVLITGDYNKGSFTQKEFWDPMVGERVMQILYNGPTYQRDMRDPYGNVIKGDYNGVVDGSQFYVDRQGTDKVSRFVTK